MFTEFWKNSFDESTNEESERPQVCYSDFRRIRTLGTGTFGNVLLMNHLRTDKYYAIKVLDKMRIIRLKQEEHTNNERAILSKIKFPFVVNLKFSFKDNSNLYMVMDYVNGGELFTYLKKVHKLKLRSDCELIGEEAACFYASQVFLTFEYLHGMSILYRDLKPENILLDNTGYIKLTDFGFAKKVEFRTYTLCGTPEYLAPEILNSKGYSTSVDWWAFGILIYEMMTGSPPFVDESTMMIYNKITTQKPVIRKSFSPDLQNLLNKLLKKNRNERLGVLLNGSSDIKNHPWFKEIDFDKILNKKVTPPFIPTISSPSDSSNFDQYEETEISVSPIELFKDKFTEF